MKQAYLEGGLGPAMVRFSALLMTPGELPTGFADQPAPDPAQYGLSTEDDGDRTNLLFRNMPSGLDFTVDDAVRDLGDRVMIGIGAESHDEFAARCARSVAERLGVRLVEFPGGHGGFSGGEYGQPAGDPDGIAAVLRSVLDRARPAEPGCCTGARLRMRVAVRASVTIVRPWRACRRCTNGLAAPPLSAA